MFLGALVAALLLRPPRAVAACLCASYIGGSVNFVALSQATLLPAAALPATMAADNLAMGALLTALIACPLRVVRRFTAPETLRAAAAWRNARAAARGGNGGGKAGTGSPGSSGTPPGAGASPPPGFQLPAGVPEGGGGAGGGGVGVGGDPASAGGLYIAEVQAALQRQVAVPVRMSGSQAVARDGSLLLTEEPAAATVWAAYLRSREREAYSAPTGALGSGEGTASNGNGVVADAGGIAAAVAGVGSAPSSTPVIPPDISSGSDSPGAALSSYDSTGSMDGGGPLARDGGPLLTAEPSPLTLQAAYARSRDTSHDSGDEGAAGRRGGRHSRLTPRSAALSLAGAALVCWAARGLAVAVGTPHLFLLAVSGLALAASAAGGWRGRALFAGESRALRALGAGTGELVACTRTQV
jgi:hypothetical protein